MYKHMKLLPPKTKLSHKTATNNRVAREGKTSGIDSMESHFHANANQDKLPHVNQPFIWLSGVDPGRLFNFFHMDDEE